MLDVLTVLVVVVAAFATAALSAVAGFGGGVLLLPLFVAVFGARDAVAVLTVAQLASNGSRVWFNRHQVDHRLVGVFVLGAVPAAAGGAVLFATAPRPHSPDRGLPARHGGLAAPAPPCCTAG